MLRKLGGPALRRVAWHSRASKLSSFMHPPQTGN
jgi:hypothetical protein